MNKAIFLDKDGTLIPDIPYSVDPALITLQPGSADGLQRLLEEGYLFIIITNQSGVAKGMFAEHDLQAVEQRMQELLAAINIPLTAFYYCPHHPDGTVDGLNIECDCRKPLPGMILRAAREYDIDLSASWMIGDILNDVEAGNRAGCRTVLIDNGNETEWLPGEYRTPSYTCRTIDQAANEILTLQLA